MSKCGRCGKSMEAGVEEGCWWCGEELCADCWEEYGHCGHLEANQANQRAREVGSIRAYDEVARGRVPALRDVRVIAEVDPYEPSDEEIH